jgi:2,3,4,5-tetrahydropyridine-2-carboxylate N-succinyltransferase
MSHASLAATIEAAWEARADIGASTKGEVRDAVDEALRLLDAGKARVAEKGADGWTVNQWLKKAVLLSFRLNDNMLIGNGPGNSSWWDKVPSKFDGWGENRVPRGRLPGRPELRPSAAARMSRPASC